MKFGVLLAYAFALLFTPALAETKGTVLTVTPALAVLGQEIAPSGIEVSYPGPSGENASDWAPDDASLRKYRQADLILLVGANYATWVPNVALPRARLVDTSQDFSDLFIPNEAQGASHQHGPTGSSHEHSTFANHFWLDPELASQQAVAIAETFKILWPESSESIDGNLKRLEGELRQLKIDLRQEFEALDAPVLFASHPVYQYLDRAFDLKLRSFHWEPDQTPSQKDWAEFDEALGGIPESYMIWEGVPTKETQNHLQQRNVNIIIVSPSPEPSQAGLREKLGFPLSLPG